MAHPPVLKLLDIDHQCLVGSSAELSSPVHISYGVELSSERLTCVWIRDYMCINQLVVELSVDLLQ